MNNDMDTQDRINNAGKALLGAAVGGLIFGSLGLWAGGAFDLPRLLPSPLEGMAWLGAAGLAAGGLFGSRRPKVFLYGTIGACGLGFVGLIGGFFVPLLLNPDGNQGPPLGIFITGPIGFSLGGVIGLIVGVIRRNN